MARKTRLEIEGGLYHLIGRGNNRMTIFHAADDFQRFIGLLALEKERLPFYLYAYCIMSNHFHLLIERRSDAVGRIMHRVLTGYSQYYNRRYRKSGHVFQGRHKAVLCQTDLYLTELVRYIHLNLVRAKMVRKPERYFYSSHREYLGLEPAGIVDTDSVLRHFAVRKATARERFADFVNAKIKPARADDDQFYKAEEGRIVGSEEFVDSMIHRIGEHDTRRAAAERKREKERPPFVAGALIDAVQQILGISSIELTGQAKKQCSVRAKELLIFAGRRAGGTVRELAAITALNISTVSRRYDSALLRIKENQKLKNEADQITREYDQRIATTQA